MWLYDVFEEFLWYVGVGSINLDGKVRLQTVPVSWIDREYGPWNKVTLHEDGFDE